MTAEPDAELIEQGRKLFSGDWRFAFAAPSIQTLPPMAGTEIAFAGRSNVGKSSLINALTGRNALARTSHTPDGISGAGAVSATLRPPLAHLLPRRSAEILSAPDPSNIFNLFWLIPWDPTTLPAVGHFLHLGAWPIIMGITMWFQMKLNPAPPDPTQKMIFDWMPLIFTFMLASFSAGLVIYWAWNNTLSVIQQAVIMKKNGAKIELWDNVRDLFSKKKGSGVSGSAS